jgi:hypothetical protein
MFESHGKNSKVDYTYGWYSASGGKIGYVGHNIKDKTITKLYVEKKLHIDSLILKHPIYYVISILDMTKLTTLPRL